MVQKDTELDAFLAEWQETEESNKAVFLHFKEQLGGKEGVFLDFIPRPGLTYSLRAAHDKQTTRPLFVMLDVIEDSPRWLSVCLYSDMISDPEERGDFVPGGLLGEDAVCFDIAEWDDALIRYVEARMDEAWRRAAGHA